VREQAENRSANENESEFTFSAMRDGERALRTSQ